MSSVAWLEEELESLGLKAMARTPFYGRGPGPQIARMDMQAATAPGRAYGKMFESLGESAGQAIETYSKNKQRSEMLDGQIGAILMNMTPEQQAQVDTSPIGKSLKKFVNQDLSLPGKESLLGGLLVDQKMDAQQREQDRVARLDQLEVDKFNEIKRRNELTEAFNLDKWLRLVGESDVEKRSAAGMFKPQERAYTEEDFLAGEGFEYKSDDIFEPPPLKRVGDSPMVESLPDSWKPWGRGVADRVNRGEIDPRFAYQAAEQVKAEAQASAIDPFKQWEEERKRETHARATEKHEQEQKVKSFDGVPMGDLVLTGSIGDIAEAKKAKEGLVNLNATLRDLDELMELGRQREDETWLSDDVKKRASQLATKVRGQIREAILGPGTVTGDEYVRLSEQVPDPTTGFDTTSATWGEEGVELLGNLKRDLLKLSKDRFNAYGVTIAGQAGSPTGAPEVQTSSGRVRVLNLDN